MVATGEVGPKPLIYVWSPETMENTCEFKGVIKKGIAALAFSPSGNRLVAAAIDDDHYMAIMDVKNGGSVLSTYKGGRDVILALRFNSEDEYASVGVKHFFTWTIKGNTTKKARG
jgi:microtubule-associated protein-like 6